MILFWNAETRNMRLRSNKHMDFLWDNIGIYLNILQCVGYFIWTASMTEHLLQAWLSDSRKERFLGWAPQRVCYVRVVRGSPYPIADHWNDCQWSTFAEIHVWVCVCVWNSGYLGQFSTLKFYLQVRKVQQDYWDSDIDRICTLTLKLGKRFGRSLAVISSGNGAQLWMSWQMSTWESHLTKLSNKTHPRSHLLWFDMWHVIIF